MSSDSNQKIFHGWRIDALALTICLCSTALVYFVGLEPLNQRYNQFVEQQNDLELKKQRATLGTASLNSAHRKLLVLQQQLADAPLQLKPAHQINNRLAELTDLASRCGIRIEDIQPGKGARALRYEIVPIHVAGTGTYRTCTSFVHQLRQTYPDTGVAAFALSGNPNEPAEAARFSFDLEWFAALSDTPAPPPTASIK